MTHRQLATITQGRIDMTTQETATVYFVRAPKVGLLSGRFPDIESARKEGNAFLMGRSGETGRVEVVAFAPGRVGGVSEPIAIGKRSRPGGPIKWTP